MKTILLLIALSISSLASAYDPRILGDWYTACSPGPQGGSMRPFGTYRADGSAEYNVSFYASVDCSGTAVKTKYSAASYTVIGDSNSNKVQMNFTVRPADIVNGDLVWALFEVTVFSPTKISAKFLDVIVQMDNRPVQFPDSEVAKLPAQVWYKIK